MAFVVFATWPHLREKIVYNELDSYKKYKEAYAGASGDYQELFKCQEAAYHLVLGLNKLWYLELHTLRNTNKDTNVRILKAAYSYIRRIRIL